MPSPQVAIVGYGVLGQALGRLFPDAVVHDPPQGMDALEAVNACRVAFICVPTPAAPDGSCDISCVEDAVATVTSQVIVICSTVPPGTTDRLAQRYRKRVVFQPEYGPGETPGHPYRDLADIPWLTFGGPSAWTAPVIEAYEQVLGALPSVHLTDATTAELAKYMENAFLATKVAFCNEFYDIAGALGVDYLELRDIWVADPRIGSSHTWVYPDDRGFGGRCLPKDLSAIRSAANDLGVPSTILDAVATANAAVRHAPDAQ